ncbi:hypothetical protein B7494_g6193 [Chlorociboria aeruginascens]|nr:hypothetical protein B7494_g6193 [Chlorociboria aeruginascens]
MYDDQEDRNSPSQAYQNSWKDNSRTAPRRPAGDKHNGTQEQYRDEWKHSPDHGREELRSPRRETRGRYTDRDREDYQSPPHDRSRSRSPYFGGPPSRTIILEGLPMEMTQEDIFNELQHSYQVEGLQEIRLIKDKRTGQSRQFAFAQFGTMPEARNFLEKYYPKISLYGPYDPNQANDAEPSRVRIAFSREKSDRDQPGKSEDDWKCEVCYLTNYSHRTLCFRCNAPKTRPTAYGVVVAPANMSALSGSATTGDSDASPDAIASQFILLRGLEPGVNEDLLAKGASKLCKTKAGTLDQTMKKTKTTSTSNNASLGAKEGSLRRVLLVRDRKSNESWRYGFAEFDSVEDAQAAMAKYKALDKFTISSKPVLVSYIHAGVFVPVLHAIDEGLVKFTFSPSTNASVKLIYWDEAAYVSELVTAASDKRSAAAANEGLVEGGPRQKKRKVEKEHQPTNKKVVAPHLQFWTNRHAEIHGLPPKDDEDEADAPSDKQEAEAPPSQSFADLNRKCCLLCSRQFKTEAEVHKHERMSQLHRDNMNNEDLVHKATAKLQTKDDGAAYRDRARERRQAFNQPKQPAAQHNRTKGVGSPKEEEEHSTPVQSKGAALLGKMGWTAGEGLGAQGAGRTTVIPTELYNQGVGLGAQGGKVGDALEEAKRQTKGSYADFLNKTKDKAKERFESLG